MSVLLLDASVWLAGLDTADPSHAASSALIEDGAVEPGLGALDLTLYEVANVAVVRWRSSQDAMRLVELIGLAAGERLVPVDLELLTRAAEVASGRGISVYDAAYAAAARRNGWQLVSNDVRDLVSRGLAIAPESARGLRP